MWSSPLEYLETNRRNEVEDNERIKTEFNEQKKKNKIKSRPNFKCVKVFFIFAVVGPLNFFYILGAFNTQQLNISNICARERVCDCARAYTNVRLVLFGYMLPI